MKLKKLKRYFEVKHLNQKTITLAYGFDNVRKNVKYVVSIYDINTNHDIILKLTTKSTGTNHLVTYETIKRRLKTIEP